MPLRCVFCGVIAHSDERYICTGCYRELPWITHSCLSCAMPVPAPLPPGVPCTDCQLKPSLFVAAVAPLRYSFPMDTAIKALKFHRKLHYQPAFSDILMRASVGLPGCIDALLPVPLHRWRRLRRGFNQAEELAAPLKKKMNVPLLDNVERTRSTPYQSGLDAAERRRNLKSAFRVRGRITAQHVLIIDDVITTGETSRWLARTLLDHGVARVSVLALARAAKGR